MGLFQIDISKRGLHGETFALWDWLSDLWLYHFSLWRCHIGGWRQTCEVVRGLALTRWSPSPFWGNWMEMLPVLQGISIFETQVHSLCIFLVRSWTQTQGIGEGRSDCAVLVVDICNPDSFKAAVTRGTGKTPFLAAFCSSALADRMRSRFLSLCLCRGCTCSTKKLNDDDLNRGKWAMSAGLDCQLARVLSVWPFLDEVSHNYLKPSTKDLCTLTCCVLHGIIESSILMGIFHMYRHWTILAGITQSCNTSWGLEFLWSLRSWNARLTDVLLIQWDCFIQQPLNGRNEFQVVHNLQHKKI